MVRDGILKKVDDRDRTDRPRAYTVLLLANGATIMAPGHQVGTLDSGPMEALVPCRCTKCGHQSWLEAPLEAVSGEERQMGAEVIYDASFEGSCGRCEAEHVCELSFSEYPVGALTYDDVENLEGVEIVSIDWLQPLVKLIDQQTFQLTRLEDELLDASRVVEVVQKLSPIETVSEAMDYLAASGVLVLGNYLNEETEGVLSRWVDAFNEVGYGAILLRDMPQRSGEKPRGKFLRMAPSFRFIVIEDVHPSGHLVELEKAIQMERPVAIIQPSENYGSTEMTDGIDGKYTFVKMFEDTGDGAAVAEEIAAWAESWIKAHDA